MSGEAERLKKHVEDEEEAQVGDLAGGKVPAIVEAPLQVNQAMDQPAVEEETLETD